MDYKEKVIALLNSQELSKEQKEKLENIFPELKESDYEKVKRIIYSIVTKMSFHVHDIFTEEEFQCFDAWCHTWLEKQKQKPKKVSIWKHWKNGIAGNGEGRQIYLIKTGNTYNLSSVLSSECDYIELSELDNLLLEKQGKPEDKGEISDGYHTFNELYRYRLLYNAAFFNLLPKELVHKSKKHHDGEECFGGGWFIVMANLPTGQISNHYELKYWDLFQIPEKEIADEWDGHTPQEAADRLHEYLLEKRGKQNPIKLNETDEKIRKAIISILKGETGYTSKEVTDKYITWLKKQGEKKSADEVMKICRKSYSDGYKHGQDNIAIALGKESIEALEHFVRSIGESGYASPYDNRTKLVYRLLEQLKQIVK